MPTDTSMPPDELVDLLEVDLVVLWDSIVAAFNGHGTYRHQAEFFSALRARLTDPDEASDVGFCTHCEQPVNLMSESLSCTRGGGRICDGCRDEDFICCYRCEQLTDDWSTTVSEDSICFYCRDNYYRWCDDCDGYYNAEDGHSHYCQCEAPAQQFTVPHPDGSLANDERVTVNLGEGVISEVGLNEIAVLLARHISQIGNPYDYNDPADVDRVRREREPWHDVLGHLDEVGEEWSNSGGTYTKRLSRFAYKQAKVKIPPDLLTQVGNIASAHSRAVNFDIEVTRDLNLPPEEFCHEGSCWWQSYTPSRCALKSNGGFGLRTFDGYVRGRAWVMPLKDATDRGLRPTFKTEGCDAYVIFNSYGDLDGYNAPRIMAHLTGWGYKKIDFAASPMYVNAGGYLVAPADVLARYADGLSLSLSEHSDLFNQERSEVAA